MSRITTFGTFSKVMPAGSDLRSIRASFTVCSGVRLASCYAKIWICMKKKVRHHAKSAAGFWRRLLVARLTTSAFERASDGSGPRASISARRGCSKPPQSPATITAMTRSAHLRARQPWKLEKTIANERALPPKVERILVDLKHTEDGRSVTAAIASGERATECKRQRVGCSCQTLPLGRREGAIRRSPVHLICRACALAAVSKLYPGSFYSRFLNATHADRKSVSWVYRTFWTEKTGTWTFSLNHT